jgi:cobyrinic acid a,c-diamide synthase
MFGLLPVASRMQREALTIGYRGIEALRLSPLMAAGTRVRGHEFHWSLAGSPPQHLAAYRVVGEERVQGFAMRLRFAWRRATRLIVPGRSEPVAANRLVGIGPRPAPLGTVLDNLVVNRQCQS